MAKTKSLIVAAVSFLTALFFLTWALQTAWIASFPGCNCPNFKYWFYLQLLVFVTLMAIGGALAWRACRKTPSAPGEAVQ